ncbi:hypothetical protein MRX96_017210 [Rhipicephalus microplus]
MRKKKRISLKALMMWLLMLFEEPNVNFGELLAETNRYIKKIVKKKWIKKKKVWSEFLRVVYCLLEYIPVFAEDAETESSPGVVCGSFFNMLVESLCQRIALFTTYYPMEMIRLTEVDHDASSPGMRCGRLVTRLSVPISQEDNTLPMQVLMQAALEMFTREYRSTTSPSDDLKTQL